MCARRRTCMALARWPPGPHPTAQHSTARQGDVSMAREHAGVPLHGSGFSMKPTLACSAHHLRWRLHQQCRLESMHTSSPSCHHLRCNIMTCVRSSLDGRGYPPLDSSQLVTAAVNTAVNWQATSLELLDISINGGILSGMVGQCRPWPSRFL